MRETHELTERLERLARVANSPRENSTRTEIIINPERERAGFEALLAQPPLRTKIKYLGPSLITAFASFGLGVIIFLGKDLFLYDIIERERFAPLLNIYGLVFIAGGAWILWRRYSRVLDYFDFSRQVIQELYLRDVSISVLQRINTNMRGALDRHGVMKAREAAIAKMMNAEFPPSVKEYFSDLSAN
jgi:hypothetical protein